ncbi:hypothetical protein V6N11_069568 [Hibiscus sabdariffa]|uniref:Uncharacterized protein n=1 Tax=Hibiscus sabdariffa TaxID=183260 RepID=A0ABR2Q375_9ROSI
MAGAVLVTDVEPRLGSQKLKGGKRRSPTNLQAAPDDKRRNGSASGGRVRVCEVEVLTMARAVLVTDERWTRSKR